MARYDDYDDAAYRDGFGARLAGKCATDVPYRRLTKKWFNWLDGWKDQDHHLTGRDAALESISRSPAPPPVLPMSRTGARITQADVATDAPQPVGW